MKKEKLFYFIIITFSLLSIIGLVNSDTYKKKDESIIQIYALSENLIDDEIPIIWPDEKGITIDLPNIRHDNFLNIHLSKNDTYKIVFTNGNIDSSIFINTAINDDIDPVIKILHLIPKYIVDQGYSKISVYPINGDGDYKIHYLSTENINQAISQNYEDYQIIDFEIKKLEIEISDSDLERIKDKRREALALGILIGEPTDWVPATIQANGKNYRVDLRLKGDWVEHIATDKWSFRIDVKGGETIFGMPVFSIQRKETREGIWPVLINDMYQQLGGVALRYEFIDVVVNGVYKGVYALEEGFKKQLIENSNKREGPIIRVNEDFLWEQWAFYEAGLKPCLYNIEPFSKRTTLNSGFLTGYATYGIDAYGKFICDEIGIEDVFDLDLLAKYMAVEDVFASSHGVIWHNLRFYVNPITAKLEPITFDDQASQSLLESYPDYLFHKNGILTRAAFENKEFSEMYFENIFTLSDYFGDFIALHSDQMDRMRFIINRDDLDYQFEEILEKLLNRQNDIQELFNDKGVVCEIEFDQNNKHTLSITNKNGIPIYVNKIDSGNKNTALTLETQYPIKVDGLNELSFELNVVNELLIEAFDVSYRLIGQSEISHSGCYPKEISFFVAGHAYGDPADKRDGIHTPFLNYFDELNDKAVDFGVFTGDITYVPSKESLDDFVEKVETVTKEYYIAPGNHDLADGGTLFEEFFGNEYGVFSKQNNLFFILSPGEDWSIPIDQIDFIKASLVKNPGISNIFVFSHQIIWWEAEDPRFGYFQPNSMAGKAGESNFWTEVFDIFAASDAAVYFIAGDVGSSASRKAIFYGEYDDNTKFIASGMGGRVEDNFLLVTVYGNDEVEIEVIALNGEDPHALGILEDHGQGTIK